MSVDGEKDGEGVDNSEGYEEGEVDEATWRRKIRGMEERRIERKTMTINKGEGTNRRGERGEGQ